MWHAAVRYIEFQSVLLFILSFLSMFPLALFSLPPFPIIVDLVPQPSLHPSYITFMGAYLSLSQSSLCLELQSKFAFHCLVGRHALAYSTHCRHTETQLGCLLSPLDCYWDFFLPGELIRRLCPLRTLWHKCTTTHRACLFTPVPIIKCLPINPPPPSPTPHTYYFPSHMPVIQGTSKWPRWLTVLIALHVRKRINKLYRDWCHLSSESLSCGHKRPLLLYSHPVGRNRGAGSCQVAK